MKDRFIELVGEIVRIEGLFHNSYSSTGSIAGGFNIIYDIPDFQIWLSEMKLEVQSIVDRTGDSFAKETLHTLNSPFNGFTDQKSFNKIKGMLFAMKRNVDKYYIQEDILPALPPKIFISHSTNDRQYAHLLVDLFENIGLNQTQLFCSSLPGYDIPLGRDVFDYLREQFHQFSLHIIILHSDNYYDSSICLNEMGAAWVLRTRCTSILLPGFDFNGMTGVVNSEEIAIKMDNTMNELQDKLNQLYDMVVDEFNLVKKPAITWEGKRDAYIESVKSTGKILGSD